MHAHEVIIAIQIFRYFSYLNDYFLWIVIIFFKHQIGVISQIVADLVTHIAKVLKTCILGLLQLSVMDIDLWTQIVNHRVEIYYVPYYQLNRLFWINNYVLFIARYYSGVILDKSTYPSVWMKPWNYLKKTLCMLDFFNISNTLTMFLMSLSRIILASPLLEFFNKSSAFYTTKVSKT